MPLTPAGRARDRLPWLISCALAVALIVVAVLWRPSRPEQTTYFYAPLSFPARDIAVAPNGHTIAVVAYLESARKDALWIYELGAPGARSIADTEGASYPFWSPDGQFLAFFVDGKLKKLEVSGGPAQTICDATQSVLAIPLKRFERRLVGFLSRKQIQAILDAPAPDTWTGRRDRVMFSTLYNTGARVSELTTLRIADVSLESNPAVRILGKGRKERQVPLWNSTARQIKRWLQEQGFQVEG